MGDCQSFDLCGALPSAAFHDVPRDDADTRSAKPTVLGLPSIADARRFIGAIDEQLQSLQHVEHELRAEARALSESEGCMFEEGTRQLTDERGISFLRSCLLGSTQDHTKYTRMLCRYNSRLHSLIDEIQDTQRAYTLALACIGLCNVQTKLPVLSIEWFLRENGIGRACCGSGGADQENAVLLNESSLTESVRDKLLSWKQEWEMSVVLCEDALVPIRDALDNLRRCSTARKVAHEPLRLCLETASLQLVNSKSIRNEHPVIALPKSSMDELGCCLAGPHADCDFVVFETVPRIGDTCPYRAAVVSPVGGERAEVELFPRTVGAIRPMTMQRINHLAIWYGDSFDIEAWDSLETARMKVLAFVCGRT